MRLPDSSIILLLHRSCELSWNQSPFWVKNEEEKIVSQEVGRKDSSSLSLNAVEHTRSLRGHFQRTAIKSAKIKQKKRLRNFKVELLRRIFSPTESALHRSQRSFIFEWTKLVCRRLRSDYQYYSLDSSDSLFPLLNPNHHHRHLHPRPNPLSPP